MTESLKYHWQRPVIALFNNCNYLGLVCRYCGHLMQRTDSLEKTLTLERIEGGEERDNRG